MSKIVQTISILFTCLFLASCAPKAVHPPFEPVDLAQKHNGMYKAKVDNFLVIYDASSSMYMDYKKEMKFKKARRVLEKMNVTIPKIDVQGGIRAYGPAPYSLNQKDPLLYGMTKYSQQDFADALHSVTSPGGGTPLAKAISVAARDLSESGGKTALIIVSDAEDVAHAPAEAAKALKSEYKGEICIYTILIGDAPSGKEHMAEIADASGCGFATDYETVNNPEGMADFVDKVFLAKQARKAVPAPKPAPVQIDSDGDGVFDKWDSCPGTPLGIKVDKYGCPLPIKKTTIELRVEFDVDKYFIRPEYKKTLQEFAAFMNDYPELNVTIEGHTDSTGSDSYNQKLSEKRAQSVAQYLSTYYQVDPARLKSIGYGESKPEATNDTVAGRQINRRVMANIRAVK